MAIYRVYFPAKLLKAYTYICDLFFPEDLLQFYKSGQEVSEPPPDSMDADRASYKFHLGLLCALNIDVDYEGLTGNKTKSKSLYALPLPPTARIVPVPISLWMH
mmetsp:Transcript_28985/g.61728  ORF Transcript_28985/g.61728 Transcript_28985/m.61728 type:complete len:104 (+) Transcript_28985:474-785(+)